MEVYELGLFGGFKKVFKKVKHAVKKVGKTVKKIGKSAISAAGKVIGGTFASAAVAADSYIDTYSKMYQNRYTPKPQSPPSYSSLEVAQYSPPEPVSTPQHKENLEKYLPWALVALLLLKR